MEPIAPPKPVQGCKFHPPLPAKAHCKTCGVALCNLCIKVVHGRVECEECSAPSPSKIELPAQSGRIPAELLSPGESAPRNAAVGMSSARLKLSPGLAQSGPEQSARLRNTVSSTRIHVCKKHPNRVAEKRCDLCSALFCFECVSEVRNRLLCAECAAPGISSRSAKAVSVQDTRDFWERLPSAFLYPLLGDRKFLLLGGAPALWLGFSLHVLAGIAACIVIGVWLIKIVRISAVGRDGDATHPSFDFAAKDIFKPFGFLLLAALAALAPAIIYVPLGNPDLRSYLIDQTIALVAEEPAVATKSIAIAVDDFKHVAKTFRYRVEHDTALKALIGLALFLFPMALGMVALFPSIDALGPPILLNALLHLAPYYVLMLIVLALGFVPAWSTIGTIDSFDSVLGLAASLLMLYCSIAAMHIFGILHASHKDAFDWVGLPLAKA